MLGVHAPKSPVGRELELKCIGGDWVIAVVTALKDYE
jgi:hypothetical protein